MSAPRVVVFRPREIETDSRGKKFALTLARLGYDVTVLSAVNVGADTTPSRIGPVRVIPVAVGQEHRTLITEQLLRRRLRVIPVFSRLTTERYVEVREERKRRVREATARAKRLRERAGGSPAKKALLAAPYLLRRLNVTWQKLLLRALKWRQELQVRVNRFVRWCWKAWSAWSRRRTFGATVSRMLPEVIDFERAFEPVLRSMDADVIHAHHPFVLPLAARVAREQSTQSRRVGLVYDARENFAGMGGDEAGQPRRHGVIVRLERQTIKHCDAVYTVSEPIARDLHRRYHLRQVPGALINAPAFGGDATDGPTVRDLVGIAPDVPLLVYSGGVSRARGVETLIDAMRELPGVHLALVTVPFPHPMADELLERAGDAADRVNVLPPVSAHELIHLLSGADVGVHPLPGGTVNHDMASPNKLYEYLHAGVNIVVSDARLMAEFVQANDVGSVFRSADPHDLARAIREALAQTPLRQDPRWPGLVQRFSWQGQESVVAQSYPMHNQVHGEFPVTFPPLDVVTDVVMDEPASLREEHAG